MSIYFIRADGTSSAALATGPETDASKCMSLPTLTSATVFNPGDTINISGLGGEYTTEMRPPASSAGSDFISLNDPIMSAAATAQSVIFTTLDGVTYSGPVTINSGSLRNIYVKDSSNIELDNITFSPIDNVSAIIAETLAATSQSGISITNSILTGYSHSSSKDVIRLGLTSETYDDIVINGNIISGGFRNIMMFTLIGTGGVGAWSPFNVQINDNLLSGSFSDAIITTAGIAWDGTETGRSSIARNTITDVGDAVSDNTNGIGIQWCIGTIVERNSIDTVVTSLPDGHGIIIDWAFKNNTYLSTDVIVRLNFIKHCESADTCAGIKIYKGTDGINNHNLITDCANGISIGNLESTNNKVYNNTIVRHSRSGMTIDDPQGNGVPTGSVLANNIIVDNLYGLFTNNGVVPTDYSRETNCYFGNTEDGWNNNTSSAIAPEAGAVLADPLFVDAANGDYNLQKESPCVGVGTKWWGLNPRPESLSGEPLPDVKIDLGAYQSTWDTNHPVNL